MSETKEKEFHDAPEKKVRQHKLDQEVKNNKKNKLIYVLEYLQQKYEFQFNLFAARTEYKQKDNNEEFRFFDERAYNNMIMDIKLDAGIDVAETDFKSLIGSNRLSRNYDPIKEYLFSVPVWDETTDYIENFLKQIQLLDENQRPMLNKTFKKWFVMLVASLIDDRVINDTCFVLSGKQGRGKTRFLETLVPRRLRFWYTYSGTFDPHDKDHKEMIGTKIQIILDEMETLTRVEQGTLKTTMSAKTVGELRRAYGKERINLFRRASFCGSINFDDFLTDPTGSRRWLPFSIYNIDVNEELNIDYLYAQALSLYKNNYQTWFDQSEIAELEKHNDQFRKLSPEEELLLIHFRKPTKEEKENGQYMLMPATLIMHDLASRDEYRKMNTNDTIAARFGRLMVKLGYEFIQKRISDSASPSKCYLVVRNDKITIENELKPEKMQEEFPI